MMNLDTFTYDLLDTVKARYPAYACIVDTQQERPLLIIDKVCHLYLDQLYAYYNIGVTMEEVADQVDTLVKYFFKNTGKLKNYEDIRKDITIAVVNAEKHKQKVERVPHRNVEDLALIYVIKLHPMNGKTARAHITYEMLKDYGISEEQLHEQAIENSVSLIPFGDVIETEISEDSLMYGSMVLTNEERCYGAAALWYKEAQQKLAEKMQGNFYVIPSSVHELILLKDNLTLEDIEGVESTILSTNEEIVEDSDFLSNHLYYYDLSNQTLCLAREHSVCNIEEICMNY